MKRIATGGLLAAALLLVVAPAVLAWPDDATARLSSTPDGTSAGQTWDVDVSFVSQGRQMTVDSLSPSITIRDQSTGREVSFPAVPTGRSGIYHAAVVFPTDGSWTYSVLADHYGTRFDFPAVHIPPAVAAPTPAASGSVVSPALMLSAVATLVLALIVLGRQQHRQMARS